jgi:hypothetical protein
MAKLQVSNTQHTQILVPVDTHLENAFAEGVEYESSPGVYSPSLNKTDKYTDLANSDRSLVKDSFRQIIAAILKVLNIDKPLPPVRFTGTISLAKLTSGGTNGSITVTDGIITAYTPPT